MFVEHKEQGEVTEAPAKFANLSSLIRAGSALLPQGIRSYYENGKTCAIGAAFHAAHGYPSSKNDVLMWLDDWNRKVGAQLIHEVFVRNDTGSTREQIADWLESKGL